MRSKIRKGFVFCEVNKRMFFLIVGSTNSTIHNWWGLKYIKVSSFVWLTNYVFCEVNKLGICNSWGQSNIIECPGKWNLSTARLSICRFFCSCGNNRQIWNLSTCRQIDRFVLCRQTVDLVQNFYVGSPLGDLNPLSYPRSKKTMISTFWSRIMHPHYS